MAKRRKKSGRITITTGDWGRSFGNNGWPGAKKKKRRRKKKKSRW